MQCSKIIHKQLFHLNFKGRTLSDVSHISNINLSDINETSCSSVLNSRLDPSPDDLNNLNVSSLQAREDLLDGCRVCLILHVQL